MSRCSVAAAWAQMSCHSRGAPSRPGLSRLSTHSGGESHGSRTLHPSRASQSTISQPRPGPPGGLPSLEPAAPRAAPRLTAEILSKLNRATPKSSASAKLVAAMGASSGRRGSETSQRVVSLPPLLPRAQAARQASQAVVPRQPPPHPAGPSRELAPGQSSRKEGSEPLEGRARSAVPPARSAPRAPRAPGSRSAAARRNDAPVVGLDWSSAKAWHATEHLLQRLVGGASPQPPQACPHCRRKFQPQSLTRHANVCVHVFQKQRKAFDALRQRVPLELLTRVRRQKHRREVGRIPSQWRQRSKAFRTAIREARAASLSKVRPLRRNSAGDLDEKSPCPHCGRKFTEIHLAKHAPVCHLVPLVQRVAQTRPENIRAAGCAVGGAHDTRPW
ncbi:unnamed protein product [Durusdinium trenchii]|uniref:C2HC/C3H-type domain-containing protein n=1 Tax=Durusdinium trenchii TaxID=1381693 RepID=A0ABP0S1J1_9DINO